MRLLLAALLLLPAAWADAVLSPRDGSAVLLPSVDVALSGLLPPSGQAAVLRSAFEDARVRAGERTNSPTLGAFTNGTLTLGGKSVSVFLNRELSWLAFNQRVLAEAVSLRHPLLERLRFLSISFNNLDEFFMVRIAGLAQLVKTLVDSVSPDGLTPAVQLSQTMSAATALMGDQQRVWRRLQGELATSGAARIVTCAGLGPEDRAFLHEFFLRELWPQLTPQSIDNAHPFPFLPNKGMGLALTLVKRKRVPSSTDALSSNKAARRSRRRESEDEYTSADVTAGALDGSGSGSVPTPGLAGARELAYAAASTDEEHLFAMEETHAAIPDEMRALILLPPQLKRFVMLPHAPHAHNVTLGAGDSAPRFVLIEDMLAHIELDGFFPEREIREQGMFRVLRDSEVEVDEEAVDLVRMFEVALKRRRKGAAIRLDVDAHMPPAMREWLSSQMKVVSPSHVLVVDGLVGLGDVSQMIGEASRAASAAGYPPMADLVFPPVKERIPERITSASAGGAGGIFAAISAKDIIVHHPFESFSTVLLFLRSAAQDPNVVAIKQTLYRTSEDSPIVKALIEAAESGKTVMALIELKARFDEEANIRWAKDMERAGVHILYGFRELKTHAKISLVVRREEGRLQSYVHLSTGNYHPQTAKVYTDLSLFTANAAIARDATRLFNFCSGYSIASLKDLEHLEVAPVTLRRGLEGLIIAEIRAARAGKPAHIIAKMNALVDTPIIDLLYEASEAGVDVTLIVRGMCALRPGVPGLSSRIVVKSIIGRFLEHSRIFTFANGHAVPSPENLVFITSADMMTRNLDWRVEAMIPILNPTVHKQVLDEVLVQNVLDEENSWELRADGTYARVADLLPPRGTDAPPLHDAHKYFQTHESLSGRSSAAAPHGEDPHSYHFERSGGAKAERDADI